MTRAEAQKTVIDMNEMRNPTIQLHDLSGVDNEYTFYFDETSDIGLLHIIGKGLNGKGPDRLQGRHGRPYPPLYSGAIMHEERTDRQVIGALVRTGEAGLSASALHPKAGDHADIDPI